MKKWNETGISRRFFLNGAVAAGAGALLLGSHGSAHAVEHGGWDRLLRSYVDVGDDGITRVAYARMKREAYDRLEGYLASLEAAKPSLMPSDEARAYWINLYNAVTVKVVLDHYPVSSIRRIKFSLLRIGPWSEPLVQVEGRPLSLDDIEHNILRPLGDPLIHYALNCASLSCPNLLPRAFTARNTDRLMREAAADYVNHRRGLDLSVGKASASKIYLWYADDFGGSEGLLAHWLDYAGPQLKAALEAGTRPERYVYDWALNDVS